MALKIIAYFFFNRIFAKGIFSMKTRAKFLFKKARCPKKESSCFGKNRSFL